MFLTASSSLSIDISPFLTWFKVFLYKELVGKSISLKEVGNLSSREVKQALSKISYIEAKFENVDQKGGGPARSMFQVEPATAVSLINLEKNSKEYLQGSRYQRRMAKEFERLSKINETIKEKYTPNKDDKNGVYKTLASMSEEEIENLLSISPIFAGTIAYAKILTKME